MAHNLTDHLGTTNQAIDRAISQKQARDETSVKGGYEEGSFQQFAESNKREFDNLANNPASDPAAKEFLARWMEQYQRGQYGPMGPYA